MKKWWNITAQGKEAKLELRGYIGVRKPYHDGYWNEDIDTGGAGTVAEFDAELKALGSPDELHVFITSRGGNADEGIAIHNILARHSARIIVTIDGFAYSIATVIAMAGDEIRMAPNGLMMIHDAEWNTYDSCDISKLESAISALRIFNQAMAEAYSGKSGLAADEWVQRMSAGDIWLTGTQAHELKLVDTLTQDVALSAYHGISQITARLAPPPEIAAMIDRAVTASTPPAPLPPPDDMTAEEINALLDGKVTALRTGLEQQYGDKVTALRTELETKLTERGTEITALKGTIEAQAQEISHLKKVGDLGIPGATASAPAPVGGAKTEGQPEPKTGHAAVTASFEKCFASKA